MIIVIIMIVYCDYLLLVIGMIIYDTCLGKLLIMVLLLFRMLLLS